MTLNKSIGCHRDTETNYIKLLNAVSGTRKTIIDISKEIGVSRDNTERMVKKLNKKGYINKIFSGKTRYVSLTEQGRAALNQIGNMGGISGV